jgi:hypothetical protein
VLETGIGCGRNKTVAYSGYWWLEQPESFRQGFALGSVMALDNASYGIANLCEENPDFYHVAIRTTGAAASLEAAIACYKRPEAEILDFDEIFPPIKLMDGLNEFYKDSRNKKIPVIYAMYYVRDEIKGKKSAKELEDHLLQMRNFSSHVTANSK